MNTYSCTVTHTYIHTHTHTHTHRKAKKEADRHELRLGKMRQTMQEIKDHKPHAWDEELQVSNSDSDSELSTVDGQLQADGADSDSDSTHNDGRRKRDQNAGTRKKQLLIKPSTAEKDKRKTKKLSWEEELDLAEKLGGPVPIYQDFSEEKISAEKDSAGENHVCMYVCMYVSK